uniref:Uncharacterized protein n=1 Tax=Neogobius melanostomus TaxID=47308 RepID=A0A8C6SQG3_9GOBI
SSVPVYGVQNNLTGTGPLLSPTATSGPIVYGVQKNVSSSGLSATTGQEQFPRKLAMTFLKHNRLSHRLLILIFVFISKVRPGSPIRDESITKDYKFVFVEKENAPVKKETEGLIMAKDTGKTFMSSAPSSLTGIYLQITMLFSNSTAQLQTYFTEEQNKTIALKGRVGRSSADTCFNKITWQYCEK